MFQVIIRLLSNDRETSLKEQARKGGVRATFHWSRLTNSDHDRDTTCLPLPGRPAVHCGRVSSGWGAKCSQFLWDFDEFVDALRPTHLPAGAATSTSLCSSVQGGGRRHPPPSESVQPGEGGMLKLMS